MDRTASLPPHQRFSCRLRDEFYAQGDDERSHGLAINSGKDRNVTSRHQFAESQVAFLRGVMIPLLARYELVNGCDSPLVSELNEALNRHRPNWQQSQRRLLTYQPHTGV